MQKYASGPVFAHKKRLTAYFSVSLKFYVSFLFSLKWFRRYSSIPSSAHTAQLLGQGAAIEIEVDLRAAGG
ncbi:MAG: hypothetical protein ACLR4Z_05800 [Butyricicoccaceae bacterium]